MSGSGESSASHGRDEFGFDLAGKVDDDEAGGLDASDEDLEDDDLDDDEDDDDDLIDDELIEVTPKSIRLRKRKLAVSDRKKISREAKKERAEV